MSIYALVMAWLGVRVVWRMCLDAIWKSRFRVDALERMPAQCIVLTGLFLSLSFPAIAQDESSVMIPPNEYLISVHHELGMHCSGFDLSYCCILPPYNSVLAQIIKTAQEPGELPKLLDEEYLKERGWVLWYEHDDNTFSEGPKLLYWNVPYDGNGDGKLGDPVDSLANGMYRHLYTFKENMFGLRPLGVSEKVIIGQDMNLSLDHGFTGKPISFGVLDYTRSTGTIVYTTLSGGKSQIPLPLSMRDYWEALGLPLTPFFDGAFPHIRKVREELIRPYQRARVTLSEWEDANADDIAQPREITPVKQKGDREVSFIGTSPVDPPNCEKCHASPTANKDEFSLYKKEFDFWMDRFPGTTEYYARTKAAAISMMEIHDARDGTNFLENYNPDDLTGASVSRLGRPTVRCQECHGDNAVGELDTTDAPEGLRSSLPLTVAVHVKHIQAMPEPDKNGRTASCQVCHPSHNQDGTLDSAPAGPDGRFRGGRDEDIRDYKGGCFLGRDFHSNPKAREMLRTQSHLNAVGQWMKENVMADGKGLYCTNCHNIGSRLLFKSDQLKDVIDQTGDTYRNQSIETIVAAFQSQEFEEFGRSVYTEYTAEDFFDPKVVPENRVVPIWTDDPVNPYGSVDDGWDYWLAAGEPHCADCHKPPFVEGMGGTYYPIDMQGKYSLMRYSKGHSGVSCQACHQSTHGLHPVDPEGADPTTLEQAQSLNPDGSSGPVICAACHVVDDEGIPDLVTDDLLEPFSDEEYPTRYEKAVAFAHTLRFPNERYIPQGQEILSP